MKASFFYTTAIIAMLAHSPAIAGQHGGTWVSLPLSMTTIVVGDEGGRITGPGWEHRFNGAAGTLDFEIAPGRRFVLRRSGDTWVGQYFHPRIGPGTHISEPHKMTFVRKEAADRMASGAKEVTGH